MSNENIEYTPQSIRLKVEELLLAMEAKRDLLVVFLLAFHEVIMWVLS